MSQYGQGTTVQNGQLQLFQTLNNVSMKHDNIILHVLWLQQLRQEAIIAYYRALKRGTAEEAAEAKQKQDTIAVAYGYALSEIPEEFVFMQENVYHGIYNIFMQKKHVAEIKVIIDESGFQETEIYSNIFMICESVEAKFKLDQLWNDAVAFYNDVNKI